MTKIALWPLTFDNLHELRGKTLVRLFEKTEVMILLPDGTVKVILNDDYGEIYPAEGEYVYMVTVSNGKIVLIVSSSVEFGRKIAALQFPDGYSDTWLYWGKPPVTNEPFVLKMDGGVEVVDQVDMQSILELMKDSRFTRHDLALALQKLDESPTQLFPIPVEDLTFVGAPNWGDPDDLCEEGDGEDS